MNVQKHLRTVCWGERAGASKAPANFPPRDVWKFAVALTLRPASPATTCGVRNIKLTFINRPRSATHNSLSSMRKTAASRIP